MPANAQGKDFLTALFSRELVANLFPANEFYNKAIDDTPFVKGDNLTIPHAGAIPTVVLDRDAAATAGKRTDTNLNYNFHEFTTDPTWLQYSEELLADYPKRQNILTEHIEALNTAFANYTAIAWAGAKVGSANLVSSTGSDRVSSVGTGNRKAFALADLLTIAEQFDQDNVREGNRFALITPKQKSDLLKIPEVKSSDFNNSKPMVEGSVGRFLGIDFFVRSETVQYTTTGATLRSYTDVYAGGTTADTDNGAALFWSDKMVRKAKGSAQVFLEKGKATHYGDLMSALVRFGATYSRKDKKGVYVLMEAPTS